MATPSLRRPGEEDDLKVILRRLGQPAPPAPLQVIKAGKPSFWRRTLAFLKRGIAAGGGKSW